jgi:F-box/WD-40 domain protein 7
MGHIDSWLDSYQNFTEEDQRIALERLIDNSTHKNIRFMRDGKRLYEPSVLYFFLVIEPRFQRDFISLLPPELALHVLSKLEPKDLVSATQTCRTWRQLADDNTIWRQKCREENVKGKQNALG